MKLLKTPLPITLLAILCYSCNSQSSSYEKSATNSDSLVTGLHSAQRRIIKTADLRARVTDVYEVTYRIEQATRQLDGLVMESAMENTVDLSRCMEYKMDSLKQMQTFTTTSHLTVRIPVQGVDSFIHAVMAYSSFVDHRNIKLDDVSLRYLGNQLKNNEGEAATVGKAAALTQKNREVVSLNEYRQQQAIQKIDRNIENLAIDDQANFATIRIDLYQPEKIDMMIVPNTAFLMKPYFADQLKAGFISGWESLKSFLVGLSYSWVFLLLGGLMFWIIRSKKTGIRWAR
ncbi:MAG TPA: DUF4349 domain-containing protein [Flavipsychrobacter sp.]|nr:DUF4349 domain-containing protein [Flavipsychrobacter sp.]